MGKLIAKNDIIHEETFENLFNSISTRKSRMRSFSERKFGDDNSFS